MKCYCLNKSTYYSLYLNLLNKSCPSNKAADLLAHFYLRKTNIEISWKKDILYFINLFEGSMITEERNTETKVESARQNFVAMLIKLGNFLSHIQIFKKTFFFLLIIEIISTLSLVL